MPDNTMFSDLQLSEATLEAVRLLGFTEPTSIQSKTIPVMLNGYDIIAKAPTGTGKTVAFGIPILETIDEQAADLQALIMAPTRELALQITDDLTKLSATRPGIRITSIYGGQSIQVQLDQLRHHPQIVVATPGRLIDHLRRRTIHLSDVRIAVLDEADRMLDMGFVRDVRSILDRMPRVDQLTMFSATMSRAVMDISWIYQRDVVELTVEEDLENKPQIQQFYIQASGRERVQTIERLMKKEGFRKVIIFCNTKHTVESVDRQMRAIGSQSDCIHGDMRQSSREKVISAFRKGRISMLVATDVASRGLDIDQVDAVFNYDIPEENERYTHRIGRTGRAGREGLAYTFVHKLNQFRVEEIARATHSSILELDQSGLPVSAD
ncbi:MAG: DEAD/DEAH box helicase [Eubacteriales bacterium]|nr:DEAD/DEAH box helicase [Eubacteriales bacterium]